MKLSSILGNTRRADISFHPSGMIEITSRVSRLLDIKTGDVIDIMTDNREFYLYVSRHASETCGRHQAQCFPSKRGSRHFRVHCLRLSSIILKNCGVDTVARFAAGDPVEINGHPAVPIITRNAINS